MCDYHLSFWGEVDLHLLKNGDCMRPCIQFHFSTNNMQFWNGYAIKLPNPINSDWLSHVWLSGDILWRCRFRYAAKCRRLQCIKLCCNIADCLSNNHFLKIVGSRFGCDLHEKQQLVKRGLPLSLLVINNWKLN